MNRQLLYGLAVALVLVVGQMLGAGLPPDLARAAHDYDQAQMHNDGAALNRLLADDYTLVNSRGIVETKAQFIADSTAPGFHVDPFVVREPIEKIWNDGAVLGGLVLAGGTDGGKRFSVPLRFADIWAKRNGRWQVVYTGVTRAADKTK
ncbi:MAG: nuclear transport factor 2 family protein [Alphaproteobacteria bacterium]|nr:nuclear transport factor 2 family protein [Alphaproteobacteria bacterium]